MSSQNIPSEFMCPITQDIMVEPVICRDAITYEKSAIETWLATHTTSPVTRQPLYAYDLIPNRALKSAIEEFIKNSQPQHSHSYSEPSGIPSTAQSNIILETSCEGYKLDTNSNLYVNVKIKPKNTSQRKAVKLVVLIDISGSMSQSVSDMKSQNGESDGFSRLDLIRHTMKTIIESLSDSDELCIIKFNSVANLVCNFTKMTRVNKADINARIDLLYADGQTNIWDALRLAFDKISTIDKNKFVSSIFLLTDGESNVNPPRGIIPTLKSYVESNPISYTLNTFGYSYSVDSNLLYQIANMFGGIYGFIPDGTMVGTIFINAISNLLASTSSSCTYSSSNTKCIGLTQANLGLMPNNQEKNILVQFDSTADISNLGYINIQLNDVTHKVCLDNINITNNVHIIQSIIRHKLISTCKTINYSYSSNSLFELNNLVKQIKSYNISIQFVQDLISDLQDDDPNLGQVKKSIQRPDWYDKWGRHYLPSCIRSHELQLCFNFKDAAPQHYSGDGFKSEQSRVESLFCTIAPPRPSLRATVATHNMSTYYNQSGGCFSGDGFILMSDSTTKQIKNIGKGDKIMTPTGVTTVKCVIKLKFNKEIPICTINSLQITPHHPIFKGEWKFPLEFSSPINTYVDVLYDLVLESSHIAIINNVNVVCLGHGFTENVVCHEYFGKKIIEDLNNHPNWDNGYIYLENYQFIRDPDTNLVIKLLF